MAAPGVIQVRMGMVSSFLVRQEGAILVDTGYPGSENTILDALSKEGIAPRDIRLILLTHGHGDHAGSAAKLKEMTGARVAVHENDSDKLRTGNQGSLHATCLSGILFSLVLGVGRKPAYPPLEPDIVFTDLLDLKPFGIQGMVVPTPGHTPGSVSVILENGDAIVGDLIMPAIPSGRPGLPYWAEDREEAKKSIRKVLSYQPDRIFLAHGSPFPAELVRRSLG